MCLCVEEGLEKRKCRRFLFLWPPGPRLLRPPVGERREAPRPGGGVTRGCDSQPPMRAGPHPRPAPRAPRPPAQRDWPPPQPRLGEAQSAARRAREAGGLLPGGRRAVRLLRSLRPSPGSRAARSPGSRCCEPAAPARGPAPRPQPPGRGGGGPGLAGRAERGVSTRESQGCPSARRRPGQPQPRSPPPGSLLACAPRHAPHSHEPQRCQGLSGPEGNPSAFRGRGLELAEGREDRGRASPGFGMRKPRPSHLADAGQGSEGACGSSRALSPGGRCRSCRLPGSSSEGWAQKPASCRSSFSLRTGFGKQAAPSAPLGCGHPGWAADSGRPRSVGARARPGGTLAPRSQRGLETEGSRALAPPRAQGRDLGGVGEV